MAAAKPGLQTVTNTWHCGVQRGPGRTSPPERSSERAGTPCWPLKQAKVSQAYWRCRLMTHSLETARRGQRLGQPMWRMGEARMRLGFQKLWRKLWGKLPRSRAKMGPRRS